MQKTILLTNDDGIKSPGLKALKNGLENLHKYEIIVVAPKYPQSAQGVSHAHGDRWIKFEKDLDGIAVEGSPATCISIALRELKIKPDLVVSGINFGENIGLNVFYSGTIGAAWESAMSGFLSLASSLQLPPNLHYVLDNTVQFDNAVKYTLEVIERLINNNPSCKLWNLNVPNNLEKSTTIFETVLATDRWNYPVIREKEVTEFSGKVRFEFDPTNNEFAERTDVTNLRKGKVVLTPIDRIYLPWASNKSK
ncbi:MAG: 5'/3'-nucleotidase SurE [Candidatus Hodarchaeales archaeon]|jgi:5'-nucleotidase